MVKMVHRNFVLGGFVVCVELTMRTTFLGRGKCLSLNFNVLVGNVKLSHECSRDVCNMTLLVKFQTRF